GALFLTFRCIVFFDAVGGATLSHAPGRLPASIGRLQPYAEWRQDVVAYTNGRPTGDGRSGRRRARLLQVAADERLDLGLGRARVEARLDQRAARVVECALRREQVQQRGGAEVVALLLDAQVLLA